ncbi:MAG: hypothetical protein Q9157_001556 [Trypethelium eluteriae]
MPAYLFYIGWTAMAAYVNLHAGVGKPLWEITVPEYSVWFKGIIGSAWLYPPMSALIRVSILLFYRRMFGKAYKFINFAFWILLALQAIYVIVNSILPIFICRPLYKAWHPIERPKYFNNWYYYWIEVAMYSTSMAFDWIILVLPVYPVLKLHMPFRKRVGIAVIFMLGAAASIVACYKLGIFVEQMTRFYQVNPEWAKYEMSLLIPPQFDEYGKTFWIPSQLEPTVALIGTSLPAIRSIFTKTENANTGRPYFSTKARNLKSAETSTQHILHPSNKTASTGIPTSLNSEPTKRGNYLELHDTIPLTT